MRLTRSLLIAGSFVLASATAHAADAVVLKNGARYGGTLVEQDPSGGVTLLLATGEVKTFTEDVIAEVIPDRQKPQSADTVLARITVDAAGATLTRPSGGGYQVVCALPCSTTLSRGVEYSIDGEGFPSAVFRGPLEGDAFELHAESGSRGGRLMGGILMISGGVAAAIGALVGASMLSKENPPSDAASGTAILVGGGVVALAGGYWLYAASATELIETPKLRAPSTHPQSGFRWLWNGFVF